MVARRSVPGWYWVVAALAVAWEAYGCYTYVSQSMIPDGSREGGYAQMAGWEWGVFAVAVWAGLAGAIGLLLRKAWATPLLLVSLIAAAVQYGYVAATRGLDGESVPIAVAVLVIGVSLVIFSSRARRAGWIG